MSSGDAALAQAGRPPRPEPPVSFFEFWPRWLFYAPVVVHCAALGLRYLSPVLLTAANPRIASGGLCGESKTSILDQVEGEERALRPWDLVHCPPGTSHTIVGAGGGPCLVLAVGARDRSTGDDWGAYTVDEAALRHGAGVARETTHPEEAYARFGGGKLAPYRDGWL